MDQQLIFININNDSINHSILYIYKQKQIIKKRYQERNHHQL